MFVDMVFAHCFLVLSCIQGLFYYEECDSIHEFCGKQTKGKIIANK